MRELEPWWGAKNDTGDQALRGQGRVVTSEAYQAVGAGGDRHAAAVGIEQRLGGIKAQPEIRRIWTTSAVGKDLTGSVSWDEAVPVMIDPVSSRVERYHPGRSRIIEGVEQQQIDANGVG